MNTFESKFVDAGGIRTHYIEAGSGEPVILIHGGGAGADGYSNWMRTIPVLAPAFPRDRGRHARLRQDRRSRTPRRSSTRRTPATST